MLYENEDGDIIAIFLAIFWHWYRGKKGWQSRYLVTDDSATEQRAIDLAFINLSGNSFMQHFLCQTYLEQTLTRNMLGIQCKKVKSHLYTALYLRYTEIRYEESILAAIVAIPEHKKAYVKYE